MKEKSLTPPSGGLIYEPEGQALEYAPLALNLYRGCGHGCTYCYAASATFQTREAFADPGLKKGDLLAKLNHEAEALAPSSPILMSFTTDPYQPLDVEKQISRQAIEILHCHGHAVQILTKGGSRALRDLDLLTPEDRFASTLTFLDEDTSRAWEPNAALPADRIATIKEFHAAGIPAWVSLEPVIEPDAALKIIKRTHKFVDLYKVGKWNYDARAKEIDWAKFTRDAVTLLENLGCSYLIKDDLKPYLPS
jgi:DNA repair photolyase